MRHFDCNCRVGRFNRWKGPEPVTHEDLLLTMDHYGIHDALVVHSFSCEYHPRDGNEKVMEVTAGSDRLHAAWVGLPHASRELPTGADLAAEMQDRGVRALFLHPQRFGFPLEDWCVNSLLGPMAERRVPVFVSYDSLLGEEQDPTDWPSVVRVCRAFPDLPVVVSGYRIAYSFRTVYAAMDACPNLHIDLSAAWLHHTIEFMYRNWGPERLVFGTGLPARDPAAALGQLNYSDIAEEDLAAVAGGNLRRLLSWNAQAPLPKPAVRFPDPVDELHAIVRERSPLRGQGFLCAHGHMGPHPLLPVVDASPAELIAEMDRLGVQQGIVFANAGLNSDERYGNDHVAAAARDYPDRFISFVAVNMNRTPEEIRREMERGFSMGMSGIKLHAYFNNYPKAGPNVEIACEFAHDHDAFIINHDWGATDRLLYFCRKYSRACFITGHVSFEAASILSEVDNLYIGTSACFAYGRIDELVEKAAPDRILFASDMSWAPVGWGLGPILYAKLPLETKRLILGGNLRRLLAQREAIRERGKESRTNGTK